jgi:hypothetical protein
MMQKKRKKTQQSQNLFANVEARINIDKGYPSTEKLAKKKK